MKKILFVCGGTAGHINPALSVANTIKSRVDAEIVFVGNPAGMEARLVPEAGYRFIPFRAMGIQRKISAENIYKNTKSVGLLLSASSRAKKILKEEQPDLVMGTGGYVSGPIVLTASKMGIKTVTHEQNALPGVTTKLLSKHVDKLLVAVEVAGQRLNCQDKAIVTGNPVRQEILNIDKKEARAALGIPNEKICILSFGGSLGASRVNKGVCQLLEWYCKSNKDIYHIHATGSVDKDNFHAMLKDSGVELAQHKNLDVREYINNMEMCLGACDLVICRAGALTLSELQGVGRGSILIPSPNVAENHQYHNAMELVNSGAACLIEEKELTGEKLISEVEKLLGDFSQLTKMGRAAKEMAKISANQTIADEVLSLFNN